MPNTSQLMMMMMMMMMTSLILSVATFVTFNTLKNFHAKRTYVLVS
jgi:hypothetical protein